jgi:hypothetical protein
MLGPFRVFPGRLSVSRTFGDIEGKKTKYGGNPRVVIATPDVKVFKVEDNYDFLVLACDGIFDKMTNIQVVQAAWESAKKGFTDRSQLIHSNCGLAVEGILKASINEKTLDNITVVVIAFKHFRKKLKAEIDEFNKALNRQNLIEEKSVETMESSLLEESIHTADQNDTKQAGGTQDSGIQISKRLNLPNYDLSLADIELQPPLVGIGRIQKRTTGSLPG